MLLLFQLDLSPFISLQPSGFYQNTIGQRQNVICSLSLPPDVDPDTVELGWVNVTNDSRVTIIESFDDELVNSSSNFSTNTIITIIQFNPLYEDDEGVYNCYSIVNESATFISILLQNFRSMYLHICRSVYVRNS